jgi:polysaccharide export outer membrane protein
MKGAMTKIEIVRSLIALVPLAMLMGAPALFAQTSRGAKPPQTAKPVQTGTSKPSPPPAGATPPPKPTTQVPATPAPAPSTTTPAIPATGTGTPATAAPPTVPPSVATASDYVVGPGDILAIVFWRQNDMSSEVVVRPDGRISVPLLNDIDVSGMTPEQLRQKLTGEAQKFVQDPNVTVVVKQINSRKVFITGMVAHPGPYPLMSSMTVLQLISSAGGLLEYADEKKIMIMRPSLGGVTNFMFNYKDMINRKNMKQNIELKPGDTVIVP